MLHVVTWLLANKSGTVGSDSIPPVTSTSVLMPAASASADSTSAPLSEVPTLSATQPHVVMPQQTNSFQTSFQPVAQTDEADNGGITTSSMDNEQPESTVLPTPQPNPIVVPGGPGFGTTPPVMPI